MLDDAVKAHKPHPKSLLDEESTEAYNEEDARQAFGDEVIDRLKKQRKHTSEFKGDWWQLALLVRNHDEDKKNPQIKDEDRLNAWTKWRRGQPALASPDWEYIHLEHAELWFLHLGYATLFRAHLEHADLFAAHLEHAFLWHAHLEHANLLSANLEHANLNSAHLEHARLEEAILNRADVRGAHGLRFDGTRVEGIRIEGNAPDPWSVLRRQYTGPWFFVHLLLLAIFFAPFVGHVLYLTTKSQFQEWSMEQYSALGERAPDLPEVSEAHAELKRRFFEQHVYRPAVWVLLGLHRGIVLITLAAIVVLYNAIRGYLTLRVSTLRDAEERSGVTPSLNEYYGVYLSLGKDPSPGIIQAFRSWWNGHTWKRFIALPRWFKVPRWVRQRSGAVRRLTKLKAPGSLIDTVGLYRLHSAGRILLWVALAAVLYNTLDWMVTTWIWVPVGP